MPILTLWFECQHNNGGSFAHLQFDLTEHSSGEYSILLWTCVIYILSIWGEVSAVYIIFKSWLKIDNCLKRYSLQLRHLHSSQSSVLVSWQEPYSGRINCFFALTYVSWSWCCDLLCVLTCWRNVVSVSPSVSLTALFWSSSRHWVTSATASCNMLDAQGMFLFVDVLGNDHSDQYETSPSRVISCGKSVKMMNLWTL